MTPWLDLQPRRKQQCCLALQSSSSACFAPFQAATFQGVGDRVNDNLRWLTGGAPLLAWLRRTTPPPFSPATGLTTSQKPIYGPRVAGGFGGMFTRPPVGSSNRSSAAACRSMGGGWRKSCPVPEQYSSPTQNWGAGRGTVKVGSAGFSLVRPIDYPPHANSRFMVGHRSLLCSRPCRPVVNDLVY
jgi:hypothetical protein